MNNDREMPESSLTSELAFNSLVFNILKSYAQTENKPIFSNHESLPRAFDFFLPQGLSTFTPTYIEVKYSLKESQIYKLASKVNQLAIEEITHLVKFILIVGSLNFEFKKYLISRLSSNDNVLVEVWDISDLERLGNIQVSEFQNVETNPSRVLVNNAISKQVDNTDATNLKEIFISQLKHEYEQEKVVLVLGAGVSMSAGLPSWSQMISVLQAEMISLLVSQQRGIPLAKAEQILELANNYFNNTNNGTSPLAQMRFIRSALSSEDYNRMVHKALYGKKTKNSNLLKAICKICKPTRNIAGVFSIITHNFDDLLENSLTNASIEYKDICKDEDVISSDDLNIFHVHGLLPHNLSNFNQELDLVFSEEEYHHVYNKPYSWSNLVQINSFRDKTCVFIGSSLSDPNLRRLLDISSRKGENPRHFAFMARPSIITDSVSMNQTALRLYREILENLNNTYYSTLGLNIIWVDDVEEIPELLLKLK